jgi:NADH-quinone oxidoreductase subunit G
MATVIVDGQEIEIGDDEKLNGIQVARRAGKEVPHYCWHAGLSVVASCRMCLVESGKRDPQTGIVSMLPKLVPACQTPATAGTVFVTDSEKVQQARAMVEEDLLIRHPIDCPICDKAGECYLQDYHFEHGRKERRADIRPFTSRRRPLGETVTLFVDRCVMCSRCVRFCREISGTSELMVINRGAHEEIDVFPGYPLANKLSGNVVDLCPVGALGDKDFLYSQRVWFMKSHDHVCAGCSTGCSIHADENQDRLYRLRPRENPHINQWWMCDEGRDGWKYVHSAERLIEPRLRRDGELQVVEWSDVMQPLRDALSRAGRLAAVLSPFQTVEEAYLLATLVRQFDPAAWIVVGPIPRAGEDERFPNGFTIRAEKCPNRQGVEKLAAQFRGELIDWPMFLERLAGGADVPRGVWLAGGYPQTWADEDTAERLQGLALLVLQELFASPLQRLADFHLPSATFVEREGSFVNAHLRLQSFGWAIRPPSGVYHDGQLFWRLLERTGLYRAPPVLQEVAEQFAAFSAAAGTVPDVGVDLRVNQLAATSGS